MRTLSALSVVASAGVVSAVGCTSLGLDDLERPGLDTAGEFEGLAQGSEPSGETGESGAEGGGYEGSSDDGDPQGSGEPNGSEGSGGSEGTGSSEEVECTHDDFPILIHQATQDWSNPSLPMFVYQARTVESGPFDELQILSYQGAPYNGPATAGTYNLAGSNYADCALCLLIVEDCNEGYQCDRVFFADEGVLSVGDFGDSTGRFTAVLRQTVFREVRLDPITYESTPVPGGETYCVDGLSIDVATYLYH